MVFFFLGFSLHFRGGEGGNGFFIKFSMCSLQISAAQMPT
jgi:hypothetical protein